MSSTWIIGRQPSLRYFVGAKAALDIHRFQSKQNTPFSHTISDPPRCPASERLFPVLLNVERPLELEMGLVVIVDELGDGGVVATAEHARGGGFGLDWESVSRWMR
jgi:hypothetical protein